MAELSQLERALEYARDFLSGSLSVDEVQQRFADLGDSEPGLAPKARYRIEEACRQLDAIRYGMCESGQRDEISRIMAELLEHLGHSQH